MCNKNEFQPEMLFCLPYICFPFFEFYFAVLRECSKINCSLLMLAFDCVAGLQSLNMEDWAQWRSSSSRDRDPSDSDSQLGWHHEIPGQSELDNRKQQDLCDPSPGYWHWYHYCHQQTFCSRVQLRTPLQVGNLPGPHLFHMLFFLGNPNMEPEQGRFFFRIHQVSSLLSLSQAQENCLVSSPIY